MPVSVGSSIQQQIPLSNTFQPGGTEQTNRIQRDERERDETRPVGTSASQTQSAETRNNGRAEDSRTVLAASSGREDDTSSRRRGSVFDETV